MSGGKHLVAIEAGSPAAASDEFLLTEEAGFAAADPAETQTAGQQAEEPWQEAPHRQWREFLGPALALATIAGWTTFYIWSQSGGFAAADQPGQWASWIRDWSPPVLLVAVIWLLAQRNSRREATRFGNVAQMLSDESARLEARLSAVNGELSMAREFIAAQARDLDSVGRQAVERLSQNADRLQQLIHDNHEQVSAIGSVSEAALENMEKLRTQLPVIANSARDVTNNIGNAGRSAHAQLQEMISGFKRLNEFGQASERQVESLRTLVESALTEFNQHTEHLGAISRESFAKLGAMGEDMHAQLDAQRTAAIEAIRSDSSALASELAALRETHEAATTQHFASIGEARRQFETSGAQHLAEIIETGLAGLAAMEGRLAALQQGSDAHSLALDESEELALSAFTARLEHLDSELTVRSRLHAEHARSITADSEAAAAQMVRIERQFAEVGSQVAKASVDLTSGAESLAGQLATGRDKLAGASHDVDQLTDSAVRLLELIQASSDHSRDEIPTALGNAEQRLEAIEQRVAALASAAIGMAGHAAELEGSVRHTQERIASVTGDVSALHGTMAEGAATHEAALQRLRSALGELEASSTRAAAHAQGALTEAIALLEGTARGAVDSIELASADSIARLADNLGGRSAQAIDRVIEERVTDVAAKLEEAAARAASTGRETAIQLRDQLAKVNELAGNLERRVAHAREQAQEQVDNDFSRRVALITESLNSNAIDIARALDTDVSDTAWAAYLKGDRGIFTRRAVSLVESGEAKAILQHYESDASFREHVSRYIHDFEAMLRQILSTRDGHALSVTLLSSDMGKLYVALAQSIERLRN